MSTKSKIPPAFNSNTLASAIVRPRTYADVKAEIDAKLSAELQRKAEQYEAEQRRALGL